MVEGTETAGRSPCVHVESDNQVGHWSDQLIRDFGSVWGNLRVNLRASDHPRWDDHRLCGHKHDWKRHRWVDCNDQ